MDPSTLPAGLAALHRDAEDRVAGPVSLLELTTDLGVPAYWAYTPAPPGAPARLRGAGSSLSARYAAERALSELVQIHSVLTTRPGTVRRPKACTRKYPALHRCHLADFSPRLSTARTVPFTDTPSPAAPAEHLTRLLERFHARGMTAWAREHHVTGHLAVVNVLVPGAERFVLVTDGSPVLPGRRALDARETGRPCADRRTA
ncbi:YcaO-like family protein [Streptomyces sp. NPDC006134]|uniref:YcaO-like family protein n=1 Tax=Streptomyces sp. NPDC006134 TaxID=3154467 RepID=UPI0034089E5F